MRFETLTARQVEREARAATIDPEQVVPLSEAVIVADHSFTVQAANRAASDLLGWTEPRHLVRDLNQVSWSILGAAKLREIQVALVMRGRWSGSAVLERRDGSMFEAFVTACSLHAARDIPSGVVVTIRSRVVGNGSSGLPADAESFGVTGLPGSFCLHYQPEVDLRDGSVTGCEALLRWWHPGLGMVSPGPALAHPKWAARLAGLETWSVFAACRQAAAWAEKGRPARIALNVSEQHMNDPELLHRVRQAVVITGVDPSWLAIDLPVAALVRTPALARRVAAGLAELGVVVVVDSVYGAVPPETFDGIPASVLKIIPGNVGRSSAGSVDRPAEAAIELARSIGATSVAKSVETAADLRAVRGIGFDRAFGHVFSPAVGPAELFRTLVGPAAPDGVASM